MKTIILDNFGDTTPFIVTDELFNRFMFGDKPIVVFDGHPYVFQTRTPGIAIFARTDIVRVVKTDGVFLTLDPKQTNPGVGLLFPGPNDTAE